MGSATSVKVLEDGTANSGRPAKNHGHKSSASFFLSQWGEPFRPALFTRRLAPYYYFPECSHSLDTEPQHARAEATRDPPMSKPSPKSSCDGCSAHIRVGFVYYVYVLVYCVYSHCHLSRYIDTCVSHTQSVEPPPPLARALLLHTAQGQKPHTCPTRTHV